MEAAGFADVTVFAEAAFFLEAALYVSENSPGIYAWVRLRKTSPVRDDRGAIMHLNRVTACLFLEIVFGVNLPGFSTELYTSLLPGARDRIEINTCRRLRSYAQRGRPRHRVPFSLLSPLRVRDGRNHPKHRR